MGEAKSGAIELLPEAERVCNHLLDQIEANNPLLTDPRDQFETAVMVAGFNGSQQAFDMAWSAVRGSTEPFRSGSYDDFAEALIEHHGTEGAAEAKQLVPFIPDEGEELTKPMVLTMVAEATDDDALRGACTAEAVDMLSKVRPDACSIMAHPSDLLLRLGAANRSETLVDLAVQALTDDTNKFEFMKAVALALKNVGDAHNMRSSLVQAAIKAQREGMAFPATIARYGFNDVLDEGEMRELLRAVHRDGKRKLYDAMDTVFGSHEDGVSVSNGPEFSQFNRLASEYDTWVSPIEHARFALRALRTRCREAWRQDNKRQTAESFGTAAYMAGKITEALVANPGLIADDVLEYGYMFRDETKEPVERLWGLWSFGVLPRVRGGSFQTAARRDVRAVHDLRDRLPNLSAARLELNAALAKSGDPLALVDTAHALTSDPSGIITRPVKREGIIERRPHLYPYQWNFLELVQSN
jgi:hypothetical protein